MSEARLWFPSPERLIPVILLQRCSLLSLCPYVQLKPVLLYLVAIMSADEAPRPCSIPGLIVVWIFFNFGQKTTSFLEIKFILKWNSTDFYPSKYVYRCLLPMWKEYITEARRKELHEIWEIA